MDTQKERSRHDEENLADPNTDVTRSENRQGAADANQGRNILNHPVDGDNQHRGGSETGTHQEGQYDKDSSKPMTDKEGMGPTQGQ